MRSAALIGPSLLLWVPGTCKDQDAPKGRTDRDLDLDLDADVTSRRGRGSWAVPGFIPASMDVLRRNADGALGAKALGLGALDQLRRERDPSMYRV